MALGDDAGLQATVGGQLADAYDAAGKLLAEGLLVFAGACANATAAQRSAFLKLTCGDLGAVPILASSLMARVLTGGRQERDFLLHPGGNTRQRKQLPLTEGQARSCCALAAICGLAECEPAPLPPMQLEQCAAAAMALAGCGAIVGGTDCVQWQQQFRARPPQHRQFLQLDGTSAHRQTTWAPDHGAFTPSRGASNDARWGFHPGPVHIDFGSAPILHRLARPFRQTSAGLCECEYLSQPTNREVSCSSRPPPCCALPGDCVVITSVFAGVSSCRHDPVVCCIRLELRDVTVVEQRHGVVPSVPNCRSVASAGAAMRAVEAGVSSLNMLRAKFGPLPMCTIASMSSPEVRNSFLLPAKTRVPMIVVKRTHRAQCQILQTFPFGFRMRCSLVAAKLCHAAATGST